MKLIISTLFLTISLSASANDTAAIREMLSIAKIAEMCGAMSQMATFQKTTNMPGGEEFMLRFYNTEAARLGKSLEQFLRDCVTITNQYVEMESMFSDKSK